MAEILDFAEFQAQRGRARARVPERESLERAIDLMRANLTAAARDLEIAPRVAQPELLMRIERLAAMIRYAMRILGDSDQSGVTRNPPGSATTR